MLLYIRNCYKFEIIFLIRLNLCNRDEEILTDDQSNRREKILTMKKVINKILALALVASMAVMMLVGGATMASAETSSGVGLAAHALTAYREGWSYVWGGTSYGAVDCSGLIASYNGVGGMRTDMLASSSEWGYVSAGVPRIHGLGLHQPGHIRVYIGSGMAVDARDEHSGVVYHNVYSKSWVEWFKVAGVSYPYSGWVLLDGDSFYYENGEYVVSTSRTLDGVTYTFDGAGVSDIAPPSSAYQATDYSSASAPSASYSDIYTGSEEESVEESSEEESIEESSEEESIEESSEEESVEESSKEESVEESSEESVEESSEEESIEESSEEIIEESSEASVEESSEEIIEESSEESIEESSEEIIEESSEASVEESSEEIIEESSEESVEESFEEIVEESSEASVEESSEEIVEESSEASIQESSEEVKAESKEESKEQSKEESKQDSKEESTVEFEVVLAEYDDTDTDESKVVHTIQNRLYELGYLSYKATGYYDEDTISAVMIFQDINGLNITGRVDSKTYELLNSDKAVSNFVTLAYGYSDNDSSSLVSALQTRLTELKYYYDKISGYYGDLTINAVKLFQKDNGLDQSGIADEETQLKIFSLKAKENPNAGSVVFGMSGDQVKKLQKRLIELRYYSGKVTGEFDEATLAAVHAYRKAAGLKDADQLSEEELNVFYSDAAVKSPQYDVLKYGYQGDDVLAVQTKLAALNYYNGKTTGVYDEELITAVKKFQKDNKLKETGYVDNDTLNAIKKESQRENSQEGNNLILKTTEAADNAFAGAAETKTERIAADRENSDNMMKNGMIIGIVVFLAGTAAVVFVVRLKKRKELDAGVINVTSKK